MTLTPAGARAAETADRILGRPPALLDLDDQEPVTLDRIVSKVLG